MGLVAEQRRGVAAEADLTYVPSYRERYYQEVVEGNWARLALAGSELPDLYGDVDPSRFASLQTASRQAAKPLTEACGAGRVPWCVAALPTPRWAAKVFNTEPSEEAADRLWETMMPRRAGEVSERSTRFSATAMKSS